MISANLDFFLAEIDGFLRSEFFLSKIACRSKF